MLHKLREWWPFLSGLAVAIFAAAAKFSEMQSHFFLLARLFRFELFALFIVLMAWGFVKLFVAGDSPWHPATLFREGKTALCGSIKRGATPADRSAGFLLAVSLGAFVIMAGYYLHNTAAFLGNRYNHADRQALLSEAVDAEKDHRLTEAIALYGDVIKRFPLDINNARTQNKIDELNGRHDKWKAAAARVHTKSKPEMTVTRYDRIAETCRYVATAEPCLEAEAYLGPVEDAMTRASVKNAGCIEVVRETESANGWIYIDPVDRTWLRIGPTDAAALCKSLGLESGAALRWYLHSRWRVDIVRSWMDSAYRYYPVEDLVEG